LISSVLALFYLKLREKPNAPPSSLIPHPSSLFSNPITEAAENKTDRQEQADRSCAVAAALTAP
jgi:hypothetical protein